MSVFNIPMTVSGGQAGGWADERAGEVQGHHRGAGADLRRDVRILRVRTGLCHAETWKPHLQTWWEVSIEVNLIVNLWK